MAKGRRYEHQVSNAVYEQSEGAVLSWTAGYSGSSAKPSPDVISLCTGRACGWELKKTAQDTFGIAESDLRQLLDIQTNFFDVGLVIKFSNREPLVVQPAFPSLDAFALDDVDPIENFIHAIPDCFDPRRSDDGEESTLRISRPSLDEWDSAQSGQSSAEKIISQHPSATAVA